MPPPRPPSCELHRQYLATRVKYCDHGSTFSIAAHSPPTAAAYFQSDPTMFHQSKLTVIRALPTFPSPAGEAPARRHIGPPLSYLPPHWKTPPPALGHSLAPRPLASLRLSLLCWHCHLRKHIHNSPVPTGAANTNLGRRSLCGQISHTQNTGPETAPPCPSGPCRISLSPYLRQNGPCQTHLSQT